MMLGYQEPIKLLWCKINGPVLLQWDVAHSQSLTSTRNSMIKYYYSIVFLVVTPDY